MEEGARPSIVANRIIGNKLVAIGVAGGSEAAIRDNELAREGGAPPLIAVLDKFRATITGNTIRDGGVTAVLVKGAAQARNNHFIGGQKKGSAVWAHAGAEIELGGNRIEGWVRLLLADNTAKAIVNDKPSPATAKP